MTGYARNFLLPQGKALRANEANRKTFSRLSAPSWKRETLERKTEAESVGEKLNGQSFIMVRQAAETGQLYGFGHSSRFGGKRSQKPGSASVVAKLSSVIRSKPLGYTRFRSGFTRIFAATVTANVARSADEGGTASARRRFDDEPSRRGNRKKTLPRRRTANPVISKAPKRTRMRPPEEEAEAE